MKSITKEKEPTVLTAGSEDHLEIYQDFTCEMDLYCREMDNNRSLQYALSDLQRLQQLLHETACTNQHQQSHLLLQYRSGISELNGIFATLQGESAGYQGDLPTSFASVVNEIAQCISQLLKDADGTTPDTDHILTLLRDYRVVAFLPNGTQTVSLHKIHLILQDNFQDSWLCKFLNIMITGFMGVKTKVIDF